MYIFMLHKENKLVQFNWKAVHLSFEKVFSVFPYTKHFLLG